MVIKMKKIMGVVVLALGFTFTAHAQLSAATADSSRKHDGGDGVPAAPEPYLMAMLAGGLGLTGGYIVYRMRKNKAA
jgi:hypothetical protein